MLAQSNTATPIVENWLKQFERALIQSNDTLLASLFHYDSYWRDVLALSWRIMTVIGADAILNELKAFNPLTKPSNFRIDNDRTEPRRVTRAGTEAIEAIFAFETDAGRGSGVLRLVPDADESNEVRAWTLLTAIEEIKGMKSNSGGSDHQARSTRAIFEVRTGSTPGRLPSHMPITIQLCSS